jgi:peptidoglycan/xylan/chitin deacetylase (PgdA/CDA1 family)
VINPGLEPEITPHDLELDSIVPDADNTAYDMHEILIRIFDDGDFLDVTAQAGLAMITGFARVDGRPVGVIANTAIYDHCPEVLEAHVKRGDELIAHGRNQVERQIEMTIEQEREMVQEVTRTFTERNGVKPVGWMSPYLTPSDHTTDLLAESGYQYCMDWGLCDEQPFHVKAATGSVLAMPYPIELNDQPAVVYRGNTGADYAEMLVDNFDELLRSSKDTSLVFAISIHTFVVGQPYRLARLRRALQHMLSHRDDIWVAMPKDIAAHYSALPADRQLHPR